MNVHNLCFVFTTQIGKINVFVCISYDWLSWFSKANLMDMAPLVVGRGGFINCDTFIYFMHNNIIIRCIVFQCTL